MTTRRTVPVAIPSALGDLMQSIKDQKSALLAENPKLTAFSVEWTVDGLVVIGFEPPSAELTNADLTKQ